MGLTELFLIAVGLSMDAFAVAVCIGLTLPKVTVSKSLIVGLYFGVFQAVMPLIGYALARWFAAEITTFDHWIAFALLCAIGGKMIVESFRKKGCPGGDCPVVDESPLNPAKMLPLALATSIDALAVGVSFAFLQARIGLAVLLIGATTLVLSMAGIEIGHKFGSKLKSKAELTGGVILVLIGTKILLEHLGWLGSFQVGS